MDQRSNFTGSDIKFVAEYGKKCLHLSTVYILELLAYNIGDGVEYSFTKNLQSFFKEVLAVRFVSVHESD